MSSDLGNRACTVYIYTHTVKNRKCCICGVDIPGDGPRMCTKCLMMNTSVGDHIDSEATITFCPECNK